MVPNNGMGRRAVRGIGEIRHGEGRVRDGIKVSLRSPWPNVAFPCLSNLSLSLDLKAKCRSSASPYSSLLSFDLRSLQIDLSI